MGNEISNIRAQIDAIDEQLTELLKRRLALLADMAEIKRREGKAVFDPEREREVLNRVTNLAGPDCETEIRLLFSTLFNLSKARQRLLLEEASPLTSAIAAEAREERLFPERSPVACAGIEGSYAQQAASRMFRAPAILCFDNLDKVFEAVESGRCPFGILPIENSAAGSVGAVYDAMVKRHFYIVKSLRLRINDVLLGNPGATLGGIRELSSHPHALAQCSGFLRKHPEIKPCPLADTAVAAKELAESGRLDTAAIAPRACAELYGLEILDDDISDTQQNYMRFICISKNLQVFKGARKLSVMLALPHKPGSLNELLARFSAIGVNLTKLESRPLPGSDLEFLFAFDFEASPRDERAMRLLAELSHNPEITHFTFLGAYGEEN